MKKIEAIKEFGGWLNRYEHFSNVCQCTMTFSVYLPPQAATENVPAVYWLSGLTCTDENFRTKAGAQRYAAELGLALIIPDTSPRGKQVADVVERYDLGQGAGFYVNATQTPWATHYHMYDYITRELPAVIEAQLPLIPGLKSICGHSMGGHGALICALKEPDVYRSVSAFAPICHPIKSAWGKECFHSYLGEDTQAWKAYDATELVLAGHHSAPMLIDQGTDDEFLAELFPRDLQTACESQHIDIHLRMQTGYDHSYHFIATFIGEHLQHHAKALSQ